METDWVDYEVRELCVKALLKFPGLWFTTETVINRVLQICFEDYPEKIPCPTDRQVSHGLKVLHKEDEIERREITGKKGRPAYEWMRKK